MNSINITGNVTKNSELKIIKEESYVLTFTIGHNERYKDKNGKIKEESLFMECNMFGNYAKTMHKYILKGTKIGISGKVRYETWLKNDKLCSKHTIIVKEITFLDKKKPTNEEESIEKNNDTEEYAGTDYVESVISDENVIADIF